MPSGLPALSSFNSSFDSLVRIGRPLLSQPKLVPPAVPTTCSGGIPYLLGVHLHEILAAAGDDIGLVTAGAQIFQQLDHR
jgi:hypothetical protein